MSDQAETLRRIMQARHPSREEDGAPVITLSSGKGGVGKSCLASHLGALLARSGLRVLLVDFGASADCGVGSLGILLGAKAGEDAIVEVEPNLWLARGSESEGFESRSLEVDLILVDVGSGVHEKLHRPAFKSVIVLTPEPASLAASYGMIKRARKQSSVSEFSVVVNQVTGGREARLAYEKLKDVADRFTDIKIDYLGHWERDEKITRAVMNRKILLDLDQGAASIPSLELLAKTVAERFLEKSRGARRQESTTGFWKTLLVPTFES